MVLIVSIDAIVDNPWQENGLARGKCSRVIQRMLLSAEELTDFVVLIAIVVFVRIHIPSPSHSQYRSRCSCDYPRLRTNRRPLSDCLYSPKVVALEEFFVAATAAFMPAPAQSHPKIRFRRVHKALDHSPAPFHPPSLLKLLH
jgi:hypothetical protein